MGGAYCKVDNDYASFCRKAKYEKITKKNLLLSHLNATDSTEFHRVIFSNLKCVRERRT